MCFAQRLKDLMDSTGTTNYQLAKAVGCHQTTVANILAGSNPQARTKQAIANYFNVAVSFLTGEKDDQTEQPAATEREQKEKPTLPEEGELSPVKQRTWDLLNSMSDEKLEKALTILRAVAEM